MGPAAGVNGGRVVARGHAGRGRGKSQVADWRLSVGTPAHRGAADAPAGAEGPRRARGRRARQQPEDRSRAGFPLGTFTCVTGVSGGGKSTLVVDTLYKAAARRLMGSGEVPAPHDRIEGLELLDKIIDIDQSPIGRTPRSNPATYTDLFAPIRDWFAELPEVARARLQAGPLQLQREGRALRGLPGRRRAEDRDALPAGRLRHLRHVQGQALQSRNAGDQVPRQVDRRSAGDDGGRGGAVFQRADAHPRPAEESCSRSGSAISRSASRRPRCRAARRSASSCRRNWRGARPAARCTSSTNRPPACISRTCASCWRCCTRWSIRATPWW